MLDPLVSGNPDDLDVSMNPRFFLYSGDFNPTQPSRDLTADGTSSISSVDSGRRSLLLLEDFSEMTKCFFSRLALQACGYNSA